MTDKDKLALGLVALAHAKKRIKVADDELRIQARGLLGKKERIPALVDGEVVGTIGKSSPKKVARVSGEAQLLAWMQENYPDCIDVVPYVEDMPKVIATLEHLAPHLVHYREVVDPTMVPKLLAAAEEAGVPVGPGGEMDVPGIVVETPDGNVTVLMEKGNEYLVEQLFTQGRVGLDGTVRQITASEVAFGDEVIRNGDRGIEP